MGNSWRRLHWCDKYWRLPEKLDLRQRCKTCHKRRTPRLEDLLAKRRWAGVGSEGLQHVFVRKAGKEEVCSNRLGCTDLGRKSEDLWLGRRKGEGNGDVMGGVGCTAFAGQKSLRLLKGSLCPSHLIRQAQAWKHRQEQCCSPLTPLGLPWRYSPLSPAPLF